MSFGEIDEVLANRRGPFAIVHRTGYGSAVDNLHRYVRIGEAITIVVLAIFAGLTYRELSALRKAPVALPNYQFEDSGGTDDTRFILTRGTWVAENGPLEPLVTTTIECRKARMECVESAASVVFVGDRGLLESQHTQFAVERWNDSEVITKSTPGPCFSRQLAFDLKEKRASSRVTASQSRGRCRDLPARTLELVTGYRVREALMK